MGRNHWFGVALVVCFLGATAPRAHAKGSVIVTFTTTQPPVATYAPNNVVAAWFQNAGGTHQRTLGLWAAVRTQYLIAYRQAAGINDVPAADAITGASRLSYAGALTIIWNLKDKAGAVVPDGTYTIRLELASSNAGTTANNNEGTFTFVKGAAPQMQTGLSNGGFTNVTIDYDPNRVACGDGVVDTSEGCDYTVQGSCVANQSGCAAFENGDKCRPEVFEGSPMLCTATCAVHPITACMNSDGCCPAGCDETTDNDCGAGGGGGGGGGGGSNDVGGGCSTTNAGGLALALLLLLRRKRA